MSKLHIIIFNKIVSNKGNWEFNNQVFFKKKVEVFINATVN